MKFSVIILPFFTFILCSSIKAQELEGVLINKDIPQSCEQNSADLSSIQGIVRENKGRIFTVFRAGIGEAELVNAKRLAYVQKFLLETYGLSSSNILYTRGERANG